MKKAYLITFFLILFSAFLLSVCSSDVNSISDVPIDKDVNLRKCTTSAQCNKDEICENGYCNKHTIRQCRTREDCEYPEECIQGICKIVEDAGFDVYDSDIITDISGTGRIVAEPDSVNFGYMKYGETKKITLTIRNSGGEPLQIYNYELDPNADPNTFSISSTFVKNSTLKPNESFTIEVSCTQTDAKPDNTSIIITSSDPVSNPLRVPVYNKYKDNPNLSVKYRTIFGVDRTFPAQGDSNEISYDMGNTSLESGKNENTAQFEFINTAEEGILLIEKITDFINTKNKFEYRFYSKISGDTLTPPIYLSGKESIFLKIKFTASVKSNNDTIDLNITTNDTDINNDGDERENGLLIVRANTRAGIFPATVWTSENSIDFGQVRILDTAHRQLQICNKGDEDLIIYNTSRVIGGKFTLTPSNIEKVLLSGLCYNIDIAFTPTKVEIVEDILQINSNDPQNPEYKINLKGEGIDCIKQADTDDPDDLFVDANCDGIDGEVSKAIFVDIASGNDSNPGSMDLPLKTISAAITKSASLPQVKYILVSEGNYYETFTINRQIGIFGGYSKSNKWSRSNSYKVNIYPSQEGIKIVQGSSSILDRLNISSQDAVLPSSSSYGLFISNSSGVRINKCTIKAGRGANGADGANGANGEVNDPSSAKGKAGTPGCEDSSGIFCTTCSKPLGGAGGKSVCGMNGGKGGDAGKSSNYGQNGEDGIGPSGSGGKGGTGGPPGRGTASPLASQYGQNGEDGRSGNNGAGGTNIGTFTASGYLPSNNGGNGEKGVNGAGGGGGGGGGGGTADCDSYGSSGGGGGAGGCGGYGGEGGKAGGASIGIFLYSSSVDMFDSTIISQNGGNGGKGGIGGTGSVGGAGGEGGAYGGAYEQDDGSMGGPGGAGGKGGNGGAGGGGGGGPSTVIYKGAGSSINHSGCTFNRGSGGSGGFSVGNSGQNGISAEIYP